MNEPAPAHASPRDVAASLYQFNRDAREFSFAFVERVMRDEESGALVKNVAMHDEWHRRANDHDRVIVMAYPESGKTNSLVIGRGVWELGNDQSLRIVIVSKTYGQAEKVTRTMRNLIDHSEEVHTVFPNLRAGSKWTDGQFTVKRPFISKTPSVQALGFRGAVTGARIDRLYIDDLEDDENTRTPGRRAETLRWLETTLFNRLTRRGRVVWTTNAWHPKDSAHVFGQRKRWFIFRYPIEQDGQPTFPAKYPPERIAKLRDELPPLRFAQVYLNDAREEGTGEFQAATINTARELGRGFSTVPVLEQVPDGAFVVTGVDLATGRMRAGRKVGDFTSMVTVLAYPDRVRQILSIERGRWQGPEILRRLCGVYQRYNGSVMVEDNGAQIYLLQFAEALLEEDGMELPPIYPWSTGKNKWSPTFGVASLAIEMTRKQWIFPCHEHRPGCPVEELRGDENTEILIQEMLDFDPTKHTGDTLMATWLARELIRKITRFNGKGLSSVSGGLEDESAAGARDETSNTDEDSEYGDHIGSDGEEDAAQAPFGEMV